MTSVFGDYRLIESTAEECDFYVSYVVESISTKQRFSAFLIHRRTLLYSPFSNNLHNILETQGSLKHPLIQNVKEVIAKEDVLLIVFELKFKSIISYFSNGESILESQIQKIFYYLTLIVDYLHSKKIAILDIQPSSFYTTSTGLIKLASFQYAGSFLISEKTSQIPGSINYAAPEVIKGPYDPFKADIWALGMTLYALLDGDAPIKGDSVDDVKEKLMKISNEGTFKIPEYFSDEAKEILKQMLVIDPSKRPSISDITNNSYVQKCVISKQITLKFDHEKSLQRIKQFMQLKKINIKVVNEYFFKIKKYDDTALKALGCLNEIDGQTELNLVGTLVEKEQEFYDIVDAISYLC